ncbi:hypothetical protein D3C87_1714990 [compost metagenome]
MRVKRHDAIGCIGDRYQTRSFKDFNLFNGDRVTRTYDEKPLTRGNRCRFGHRLRCHHFGQRLGQPSRAHQKINPVCAPGKQSLPDVRMR